MSPPSRPGILPKAAPVPPLFRQVRLFITLFCVSVAAGLIIHHPAAVRFYRGLTMPVLFNEFRAVPSTLALVLRTAIALLLRS